MIKTIYFLLVLAIPQIAFSQTETWIETEAEIIEITKPRGKRRNRSAIVVFTTENGDTLEGTTQLFSLPIVGSFKAVGDQMTISYQKDNPYIIKTLTGKFVNDYGMYILVFLGIVFSIRPILKVLKVTKEN